jgi:hypothetical protein
LTIQSRPRAAVLPLHRVRPLQTGSHRFLYRLHRHHFCSMATDKGCAVPPLDHNVSLIVTAAP